MLPTVQRMERERNYDMANVVSSSGSSLGRAVTKARYDIAGILEREARKDASRMAF